MTLTEKVRAVFLANPNMWVDGRELANVGGYAAWRSRVAECRTRFAMTIVNEVTRHDDYTVSKYRYLPGEPV